jgi:hypothetical protein
MNANPPSKVIVWWVLWAAFLTGVVVMYQVLGRNAVAPETTGADWTWIAGLVPVALSVVIRWVVLPRLPAMATAFPIFVLGIAMAEASLFLGLFLFPAHKQELFYFSLLGIAQFAPYFAGRYEA